MLRSDMIQVRTPDGVIFPPASVKINFTVFFHDGYFFIDEVEEASFSFIGEVC